MTRDKENFATCSAPQTPEEPEAKALRLRLLKPPELPGVELMLFENFTKFWPVVHISYDFGCMVELGPPIPWSHGSRRYTLGPTSVALLEPGDLSRIEEISQPTTYSVLLLSKAFMATALESHAHEPLGFSAPQIESPPAAGRHRHIVDALVNGSSSLDIESALFEFMRHDVVPQLLTGPLLAFDTRCQRAVRIVREHIHDNPLQSVGLAECARVAGLSMYHLHRCFAEQVGATPHQYLTALRVRHARDLLAKGYRPAEVATLTGFSNHPHLTRVFQRHMGMPPSEYLRRLV